MGNPLILIAEIHDDTRAMLRQFFTMHGFPVAECHDTDEAVRTALERQPSLMLVAHGPTLNGLSVVRTLRASSATHAGRIVFISDDGRAGDEARARAAGCDDYLLKPFDPMALLAMAESIRSAQHPR